MYDSREVNSEGGRNMNNKDAVIVGTILVGLLLLSNPHCTRGCRTVGEHLIDHALDEFIAGLF